MGLRKKRLATGPSAQVKLPGHALDLVSEAQVLISSEAPKHPIDNVVDGTCGPGSSQWVAETAGPQTLVFKFDRPHHIKGVTLEIEETEVARTQEISLEVAFTDDGTRFTEILRQEYNFSPAGTTFERETWPVDLPGATAIRLHIKPHKGGGPGKAKLNYIAFTA